MDILLPNGVSVKKIEKTNSLNTVSIKSNTKLQEEEARIRHRIDELPIQDGKMNTISVILSYYLFGLNTYDISIMTKIPEDQIKNIMMLPAFDEMVQKVTKAIIEKDTDDVRTFISQQSKKAATKIVQIMETAPAKYSLAAAQDLLDRSGHRPVDTVEHINKMDGELRIVHIKKDETANKQIQDVEFEEIK